MHFWIDKRSQACGFNGRHGVPASLASGRRRRNKSMIAPVHRLQSIESSTVSEQFRRPFQQPEPQARADINNGGSFQSPEISRESTTAPMVSSPPQLAAPAGAEPPYEGAVNVVPHAQLMRLGGLTKYGMWASFGLTTISVAATKFYVDQQGTFEILLLCTLGALTVALLVSCILTICKRSAPQQFINVQAPQPQDSAIQIQIPEAPSQRETIISPLSNMSPLAPFEARRMRSLEHPPPPYHIAILLPVKDSNCADIPPPTYENAVRVAGSGKQSRTANCRDPPQSTSGYPGLSGGIRPKPAPPEPPQPRTASGPPSPPALLHLTDQTFWGKPLYVPKPSESNLTNF